MAAIASVYEQSAYNPADYSVYAYERTTGTAKKLAASASAPELPGSAAGPAATLGAATPANRARPASAAAPARERSAPARQRSQSASRQRPRGRSARPPRERNASLPDPGWLWRDALREDWVDDRFRDAPKPRTDDRDPWKATDPYSGDYPQSLGEKHRTTLLALADLLHTRGKVADEELAQAWNRETDAYTRTLEARRNDLKRPFVRPRPRRRSPRRADQRARSAPTEPAPAATEGHQPAATLLDPPAQGEPPAPPCCNHFMRLVCPRCEGAKRGEGTLLIAPYVLQDEVREKKRTLSVQRAQLGLGFVGKPTKVGSRVVA